MKLSIKEAETMAQKDGKLPEGAVVENDKGEVVDFVIKSKEVHEVEVTKEYAPVQEIVEKSNSHTTWNKLMDESKNAKSAFKKTLHLRGTTKALQEKALTMKGAMGEAYMSDDVTYNEGGSFVVDEVLGALVPAFDDALVSNLATVPVKQNSFRLLSWNVGNAYPYVLPTSHQAYQGQVFQPTTAQGTISSSLGQTIQVQTYTGIVNLSDEAVDDIPAIAGQVGELLGNDLAAQTQSGALSGIFNSPSAIQVPRTTSGAITGLDLYSMYAQALKGSPNPRWAWVVSPEANSRIQTLRDYNTALGGFITYDQNNLGLPAVRVLGIPIIECWMNVNTLGLTGDVNLVDLNSIVMGVRGTQGPSLMVNPFLWYEYNVTGYRLRGRFGFGSRLQNPVTRGTTVKSNIVQLFSGTTGGTSGTFA